MINCSKVHVDKTQIC